ncbi:hypothetical protein [Rhodovibrio salinarum]|uniref:Uncharacterized protein n=1 Tax=Rhodovibrio salinarum TaxID=1087 RepID=A0A934UZK4_9PROT|nr:hypothetical protein [Rhodovibrio salinarum]MBK1696838.1 hypothetical protein [Rhodovibrio salinarum]
MSETTRTLRYPPGTLIGDYLRAAFGVAVGACVLALNPIGWGLGVPVGGLMLLFAGFGVRTAMRQMTRVEVQADGLIVHTLTARPLTWQAVTAVRLRYYGSKRERKAEGGFYQLKLQAPGARFSFESGLTGFDYLVWRAGEAARANGRPLDTSTVHNMQAFGIDPDGTLAPPPAIAARAREIARTSAPAHDANACSGERG